MKGPPKIILRNSQLKGKSHLSSTLMQVKLVLVRPKNIHCESRASVRVNNSLTFAACSWPLGVRGVSRLPSSVHLKTGFEFCTHILCPPWGTNGGGCGKVVLCLPMSHTHQGQHHHCQIKIRAQYFLYKKPFINCHIPFTGIPDNFN